MALSGCCALLSLFLIATRAEAQVPSNGDPTIRLNDRHMHYRVHLREIRRIDGADSSGSPAAGAANTPLLRLAAPAYPGDGSGTEIITATRANPRTVSNVVADQAGFSFPNQRGMSDAVWAWGQFVDHDLDLTHAGFEYGIADIPVESSDDVLAPGPLPFLRSEFAARTGVPGIPRQQVNAITSFLDASNVYGSDAVTSAALRTFSGGRLAMSDNDLLPFENSTSPFFLAGDVRANENLVLTCLHTLFAREHNRLAALIALIDPQADDEEIYQLARKLVGAQLQTITVTEFLPALLGDAAPTWGELSYDRSINPAIANEFSTAFYRVGHTLLSANLTVASDAGITQLPLRDAFFNPFPLIAEPQLLDGLLAGLPMQPCQEVDTMLVDDVRNFLFGAPGQGGIDLAALNIQRGRDHGLPDYNTLRAALGVGAVSDFSEITSDVIVQQMLAELYGSVDNIDAWVGALAEDHLVSASVGPTIAAALQDQFRRVIAGDRFSVVNDRDLRASIVDAVIDFSDISLASVMRRNTRVRELPERVLFMSDAALYDVRVSFDPDRNRVYITGNRGANAISVTADSEGLWISGTGGTLINGLEQLRVVAGPRPALTIDLGAGDDLAEITSVDLSEAIVMLGDGADLLSITDASAKACRTDCLGNERAISEMGFTRGGRHKR